MILNWFKQKKLLSRQIYLLLLSGIILSCGKSNQIEEINIGYIGPLTTRATDLGVGPSKAMELAVEQYNSNRTEYQPKVNFFIEDDKWKKENALPAYEKLRSEHNIDLLFISNSDGTVAVQDAILEDGVICINPLNNDALLSTLNENTFKIAKSTEEANGLIAIRIIELGLKKAVIMHYPNDFMTRAADAVKKLLDKAGVVNEVITIKKDQEDFTDHLQRCKADSCDAYVFFGYKEFGFAMKQSRDMGINAPFFGSTVLLVPEYYDNSEGEIVGTECTFFTEADGNYVLANEFLDAYEEKFGNRPYSLWPPMQAYDAMNLVLNELKTVNDRESQEKLTEWLRNELLGTRYYQGVCGNLSIGEDGASKGIYFSLYEYAEKGKLVKVKR